jgi:excisionase family DNA binding protein
MHGKHSAPTHGPAAQTGDGQDRRLAYSVAEAARRLDVSPMTLYREIAAGRLAAIRIRDRLLIPRIVLERLVDDAIDAATDSRAGGGSDVA